MRRWWRLAGLGIRKAELRERRSAVALRQGRPSFTSSELSGTTRRVCGPYYSGALWDTSSPPVGTTNGSSPIRALATAAGLFTLSKVTSQSSSDDWYRGGRRERLCGRAWGVVVRRWQRCAACDSSRGPRHRSTRGQPQSASGQCALGRRLGLSARVPLGGRHGGRRQRAHLGREPGDVCREQAATVQRRCPRAGCRRLFGREPARREQAC